MAATWWHLSKEVPYAVLLVLKCPRATGVGKIGFCSLTHALKLHILAWLPDVNTSSFTSTRGLPFFWADMVRMPTLDFLLQFRSRLDWDNEKDLGFFISALRYQILVGVGINTTTNLRLVRLVGEGPWPIDAKSTSACFVMEKTFRMLLQVALSARVAYSKHERRCFLNEFMHLNEAWDGIHGWKTDVWRKNLANLDLRVQNRQKSFPRCPRPQASQAPRSVKKSQRHVA